jgi:hypothetical protein
LFQRIVSVDRIDDCVSIGSNPLFGIEVRIARDCPARGLINAGKVIVSMGTNAAIAPIGSSRMPGIVSIRLAQLETPCTMPETACTRHECAWFAHPDIWVYGFGYMDIWVSVRV